MLLQFQHYLEKDKKWKYCLNRPILMRYSSTETLLLVGEK